jgi:hypothetical protein
MTATRQLAGRTHHRIPLQTYLDVRLGRNQPWWRQTDNVLVRPLAAPSLAEFWRRWNPVWGFFLSTWVYRPARRVLPHPAAVMATFMASGLVHNLLAAVLSHCLNPFVTVWFQWSGTTIPPGIRTSPDEVQEHDRGLALTDQVDDQAPVAEGLRAELGRVAPDDLVQPIQLVACPGLFQGRVIFGIELAKRHLRKLRADRCRGPLRRRNQAGRAGLCAHSSSVAGSGPARSEPGPLAIALAVLGTSRRPHKPGGRPGGAGRGPQPARRRPGRSASPECR